MCTVWNATTIEKAGCGAAVTRRQLMGGLGMVAAEVLAACRIGERQQPAARRPVTLVWAYWGSDEQVRVREQVMTAYQQLNPHVTIERIHNTGGLNEHFDKVQVMIAGGSQLDLFMSSPIWVPNLALRNLYLELNSLMAKERFPSGDYAPAALDAFAYKGKQYALPEIVNFGVVFYNKQLFQRAGVPFPADTWTWEQFLDTAQRLTARRGGEVEVWGVWPVRTDLNNTMPYIWMNGGQIFDDEQDPRRSTMATPPVVEAVEWRANWALRHRVAPTPDDPLPSGNAFFNGIAAMYVSTVSGVPGMLAAIQAFEWDAAPLPRGPRGLINFAGSAGQGIASGSKQVDEAWHLLRYQVSPDGLRPYTRAQWALPPHKGLAATEYMQLQTPPANRRVLVNMLDVLRALPKAPFMLETYNQVYGVQLNNIYDGKVPAREGCRAIDDQIAEFLRRSSA
jgi:multiple sugar transport system substrate-binding protein